MTKTKPKSTFRTLLQTTILASAACGLLALSACNAGDGTVEGCSTALYGTFVGHSEGDGLISAYLLQDEDGVWLIDVAFLEPDDTPDDWTDNTDRLSELEILEDGTLEDVSGAALTITNATLDFDTCETTGDWDIFGQQSGTFTLGRYNASPF